MLIYFYATNVAYATKYIHKIRQINYAHRSKESTRCWIPLRENVSLQDVNPESENRVKEAEAESQNNEVRVQFADETPEKEPQELTPLSENETEDEGDENRDKRQGVPGSSGSGNILFDIIRVSRTIEFILNEHLVY